MCINTEGGFECVCNNSGYAVVGENGTCQGPLGMTLSTMYNLLFQNSFATDINECQQENTCHSNASCINMPGSYMCECKPKFTGDGHNCEGNPSFVT